MIQRLVCGVLLVALTPAIQGQEPEQRLDAVREFKRYFRKFKDPKQKVEAVFTLKGNECVPAGQELVKLLDHDEVEVRNAAMSVLGTFKEDETFQNLLAELPDMKNQARRATLIEVLGNSGVRRAVPVMAGIVAEDRRANAAVKYQIARALGRIGGDGIGEPLSTLLQDGDALVRMGALDAVRERRIKALAGPVVALLEDKEWQVVSAAVRASGELRIPEAIDQLIVLMREGGRLEEETADALFSITALDFGADPDQWQKQWGRLKALGNAWRIPTDEELEKARESRRKYDAIYGKKDGKTSFGGIPTTSTRVLFIIDVSGSMEDLVVEREKFDAGYKDFSRLTIVKTELMRTIEGLGPETIFNIVSFATDTKPWKKYLVPANVVNKASAMSWVKRLKPVGGSSAQELAGAGLGGSANLAAGKTNTLKALMYPFGIDPAKKWQAPTTGGGKAIFKNKLDTVFFLSDGRPSTGKMIDTKEILAEVKKVNEVFKIVIHTIAIGDFQKDFLRNLAEENAGVFVDLGR